MAQETSLKQTSNSHIQTFNAGGYIYIYIYKVVYGGRPRALRYPNVKLPAEARTGSSAWSIFIHNPSTLAKAEQDDVDRAVPACEGIRQHKNSQFLQTLLDSIRSPDWGRLLRLYTMRYKSTSKATSFLLAICSIIITSKQYIGDPIDCILDTNLDQEAINTYCWIFSTFTVSNTDAYQQGLEPYPGVGSERDGADIVHQKYYQWVCFILAIQAAMFIFPHCLWRVWEGGRIKMLVADLSSPMTENWTAERKHQTIKYLSNPKLHNLKLYALQFLFCEFLNVLNIIFQIYVWNTVFNNRFLTFGPDVIQYAHSDDKNAYDPISTLFPKMTKCTFRYYGPSGSVQRIDAVCVLPLNIVNEKMFIFLWFWFFFLCIMTVVGFLYDVVLFRGRTARVYVLQAQARCVSRVNIRTIVNKGNLGDWFLLHQLGRSMNPFVFGDLLVELAEELSHGKHGLQLSV